MVRGQAIFSTVFLRECIESNIPVALALNTGYCPRDRFIIRLIKLKIITPESSRIPIKGNTDRGSV
jgi:hypothetical protein